MRYRAEKYLSGEHPTKRALSDEKRRAIAEESRAIEYKNSVRKRQGDVTDAVVDCYREPFGNQKCPVNGDEMRIMLDRLPKVTR